MPSLELQLVYEGNGRFRTASRFDLTLAGDKLGPGEVIDATIGKKRSAKQHRWFFAMVASAFDNQTTGPHFDDSERMRKWLLIRAGHCTEQRFAPRAMTPEVAAWLRQTYDDIDFATDGAWIYARIAKSIAWSECDGARMGDIADKVVDIICAEIVPGTTRADWEPFLREGRQSVSRKTNKTDKSLGAVDA